jgi:hypothetical protein
MWRPTRYQHHYHHHHHHYHHEHHYHNYHNHICTHTHTHTQTHHVHTHTDTHTHAHTHTHTHTHTQGAALAIGVSSRCHPTPPPKRNVIGTIPPQKILFYEVFQAYSDHMIRIIFAPLSALPSDILINSIMSVPWTTVTATFNTIIVL